MKQREKEKQLRKLDKQLIQDGSHPAIRKLIVRQHGEMLDLIEEIQKHNARFTELRPKC